jgi:hypothetical protein
MLNRNHPPHRFAFGIGAGLAVSLLIVIASLVSAASHIPAYLS